MEGLDELERDLTKAIEQYPASMRAGLQKIAREFKKSVWEKTPEQPDEEHRGNIGAKLRKKFGIRTLEDGPAVLALVYNSAPHFHLIENGHDVVRGGKVVSFAPGKHMMEKTRTEYAEVIPERFREVCDKVLEEHNL